MLDELHSKPDIQDYLEYIIKKHETLDYNGQYYNYHQKTCAQRMMVIAGARNFSNATRDHFIGLIILIVTGGLANIHKIITSFFIKKQYFSKLNIKESCEKEKAPL